MMILVHAGTRLIVSLKILSESILTGFTGLPKSRN